MVSQTCRTCVGSDELDARDLIAGCWFFFVVVFCSWEAGEISGFLVCSISLNTFAYAVLHTDIPRKEVLLAK